MPAPSRRSPSTTSAPRARTPGMTVPVAKGIFNRLAADGQPDVIVAELGDGILGEYGVQDILRDAELAGAGRGVGHGGARSGRMLGRRTADAGSATAWRSRCSPGRPPTTRSAATTSAPRSAFPAHNALRDAAGAAERARIVRLARRPWSSQREGAPSSAPPAMPAASCSGSCCSIPEVTEVVATSRSQAGKPVARGASRRSPSLTDARFAGLDARRGGARAGRRLPGARARRVVARWRPRCSTPGPGLVVDLAADFRVARPPALRAVLRRASRARVACTRFRYGAGRRRGHRACAAPRRSPRRDASPRRRSSRSIRWRGGRRGHRRRSSRVTGLERRRRPARARPRTTRRGPQPLRLLGAAASARSRGAASWRAWTGAPDATARLMTHSGRSCGAST